MTDLSHFHPQSPLAAQIHIYPAVQRTNRLCPKDVYLPEAPTASWEKIRTEVHKLSPRTMSSFQRRVSHLSTVGYMAKDCFLTPQFLLQTHVRVPGKRKDKHEIKGLFHKIHG